MTRNYLRVRGEYGFHRGVGGANTELPPRARRILGGEAAPGDTIGTTSACAENTGLWTRTTHSIRNYLRVRGEYLPAAPTLPPPWELPPRARRILGFMGCWGRLFGTTSACAENTLSLTSWVIYPWNYLRVRGEYTSRMLENLIRWELPPRARRIPVVAAQTTPVDGTTSACAENTFELVFNCAHLGNYLRVRGEYGVWRVFAGFFVELPPRARRILHRMALGKPHQGTTSACAENTAPACSTPSPVRNYLRVRGEYDSGNLVYGYGTELPPRARRILIDA